MTDPVTAPLTLAAVLDLCLASVQAGTAIVPEGAGSVFAEPGLELRVSVATEGGEATVTYRPTAETVTGCSLWGGNFSDEQAPFTMLWADRGAEMLAWLDMAAGRPDAIDLRRNPDYEAVFVCDDPGRAPIVLGVGSFRFSDETDEEPPRFPPDGGILADLNRWPGLTCDTLLEAQ